MASIKIKIQAKFSVASKTRMSCGCPRKRVITRNTTERNDWQHGAVFNSLKYVADESDLDDELEGGDDTAFAGADEAVEISPSRDSDGASRRCGYLTLASGIRDASVDN